MKPALPSQLLAESLPALQAKIKYAPEVALVLGSGFGAVADTLLDRLSIPYTDVPNMPTSAVVGHAGNFVFGELSGRRVVVMQGRVHLYEGYSAQQVVFGARLMIMLGARTLMVSNAAGGIRDGMQPGELMLIEDHLNLTGHNPLLGAHDAALGPRFPDMSAAYDPALLAVASSAAQRLGMTLQRGVYAGLLGPNYETPAEIRMLRSLHADAVGMSTVLEVLAAHHMGARVLGISCITNLAAGLAKHKLSHSEVEATARASRAGFTRLLESVLQELPA
jgi:purine-nucleoside phosphorylase